MKRKAARAASGLTRGDLKIVAGGAIDAGDIAKRLGIPLGDLAETLGLGRDALGRAERAAAPKSQQRLRELVELLNFLRDWAGSERAAFAWLRSEPIPAFGGRSPEALLKSGKAGQVRDYLDHIALGGFA